MSAVPEPATARGRRALAVLQENPTRALVALDFDGTLAPVVDRPEDAYIHPEGPAALAALARKGVRVAVITGRPVQDVRRLGPALFDLPRLVVTGHYGLEWWEGGRLRAPDHHPGVAAARDAVTRLVAGAPEGVALEDKSRSVAVHTRRAKEPEATLEALRPAVDAVAAATGLEVVSGRLVLELRPPGTDKGSVLRDVIAQMTAQSVVFCGDDLGDMAAVAALRDLDVPSIVVCSDSPESPAELRDSADLVVDGPPGVVQLLFSLAAEA